MRLVLASFYACLVLDRSWVFGVAYTESRLLSSSMTTEIVLNSDDSPMADDFEMSDDGSCRGVYKSRNFRCNDKTACRFARSALLFDSECILETDNCGILQSIKFKEPTPDQWRNWIGNSGPPSLEDYNISGKVQNVIYNVADKVGFIAIDDSRNFYSRKLHKTLDGDLCHIAVNAYIMNAVVVMQARPQADPDVPNQVLDLNLKDQLLIGPT